LISRRTTRFEDHAALMRERSRRGRTPKPERPTLRYCVNACGVCRFCAFLDGEPFDRKRWTLYRELCRRDPVGREGKYDELQRDLWRMRVVSSWELIANAAKLQIL